MMNARGGRRGRFAFHGDEHPPYAKRDRVIRRSAFGVAGSWGVCGVFSRLAQHFGWRGTGLRVICGIMTFCAVFAAGGIEDEEQQ